MQMCYYPTVDVPARALSTFFIFTLFFFIQNIWASAAGAMSGRWIGAHNKVNNDPLLSSYWFSITEVGFISSCSTLHITVGVCAEACAYTDGRALTCKAILRCIAASYVIDLSQGLFVFFFFCFKRAHLPGSLSIIRSTLGLISNTKWIIHVCIDRR